MYIFIRFFRIFFVSLYMNSQLSIKTGEHKYYPKNIISHDEIQLFLCHLLRIIPNDISLHRTTPKRNSEVIRYIGKECFRKKLS